MKRHAIISTFVLMLVLLTVPSSAQTITDLVYDEDVLVNLTEQQSAVAYNVPLDAPAVLDVSVQYLGAPFSMTLEIFDASGQLIVTEEFSQAGALTVSVPAGENFLLFTALEGQSGRAVVNFSINEDDAMPADEPESSDLVSGEWMVMYGESSTSCPDDLTLEEAWLPSDGTVHVLSFSQPPQALEFHEVVAPEGVQEDPEFFETELLADGSFAVFPGIQTQPYTYVYTVLSATQISLTYTETIALSDCVLTVSILLDAISETSEDTATLETTSVEGWAVSGDANTPVFNEDGSICASDQQQGETWFFVAPQDFVDDVVDGYGSTLIYELSQDSTSGQFADFDVILVVGNGFFLVNQIEANPDIDFTPYSFVLDETAGWVVDTGELDATDPELFQQMLSDVTQVWIRGEYSTQADTGCLRNPQVTD